MKFWSRKDLGIRRKEMKEASVLLGRWTWNNKTPDLEEETVHTKLLMAFTSL